MKILIHEYFSNKKKTWMIDAIKKYGWLMSIVVELEVASMAEAEENIEVVRPEINAEA